jgi:glyceraldehyde-3-phosphate dehydrogenase/erythrose-4-phosphate dehydrogenase
LCAALTPALPRSALLSPLCPSSAQITGEDSFSINGKEIKVVSSRDPTKLPWKAMGVDLVIEGTGVFIDRPGASKHIEAGASKVGCEQPGFV